MSSERGDSNSNQIANRFRVSGRGYIEYPTTEVSNRTPASSVTPFEGAVFNTFNEAQRILLSKHHDYGPTNIANAPGGALNGLRVRIHDKTARINNLIDSGKSAQHESLRDSFLDLMNYAAIALLVIDGNWPGVEPDDTEADCG